ncbi:MAG: CoA transferase, partial [Bacteroidia bacterium]|nr:CoA transferase [Bacteroidia bacterium]
MNRPLSGVRILDLSRLLPGPLCTLHFADLGADVIKIEDPSGGDYARWIPPVKQTYSQLFLSLNRNKRSMILDLTTESDRQVFYQLVKTADILVESFRPGVTQKLQIDYETLSQIQPKLVYCSISGFGQTGPYQQKAGHDLNFMALAGILQQIGTLNECVIPNFQIGDIVGGSLNAAFAIMVALFAQRETGKGQQIDIAMLDGAFTHNLIALATLQNFGESLPPGSDLLTGGMPFYQTYRTADNRFLAVGAIEFKFWATFCEIIGKPELKNSHIVVGEDAHKVKNEIQATIIQKTLSNWLDLFENADCCVSPVLKLEEAMNHPQIIARDLVIKHPHPT